MSDCHERLGASRGRISPNVAMAELTGLVGRSALDLVSRAGAGTIPDANESQPMTSIAG